MSTADTTRNLKGEPFPFLNIPHSSSMQDFSLVEVVPTYRYEEPIFFRLPKFLLQPQGRCKPSNSELSREKSGCV